jgi:glycosyl transferase, family 25
VKALLINLDRATERLAFQTRQLLALGISYERIEATGTDAPEVATQPYWLTWERPMRPAERACLVSHQRAWQIVANGEAPVLVLEDDAVLSRQVPHILKRLLTAVDIDYVSLETRGRRKLLSRTSHPELPLRRLYQDRSGAAAYVLWPEGARKLLAASEVKAGLADAVICACYELNAFQADPPLALQSDQCASQGVPDPLSTRSSISSAGQSSDKGGRAFRFRRMKAQLRMAMRQARHAHHAGRELLRVIPSDFVYLDELSSFEGDHQPVRSR